MREPIIIRDQPGSGTPDRTLAGLRGKVYKLVVALVAHWQENGQGMTRKDLMIASGMLDVRDVRTAIKTLWEPQSPLAGRADRAAWTGARRRRQRHLLPARLAVLTRTTRKGTFLPIFSDSNSRQFMIASSRKMGHRRVSDRTHDTQETRNVCHH